MLPEKLTDGKTLEELKKEVGDVFFDIPFGNTKYQIENFIINASITPERRFRTIGLELLNKLQEIERIKYTIRRLKIDEEELEYKLEKETNDFTRRRLEIDLEVKKIEIENTKKTIKDYLREVEIYYAHFKVTPKVGVEEFEKSEEEYFKTHLRNQVVGMEGAHLSLLNMGYGINERGEVLELSKLIERK